MSIRIESPAFRNNEPIPKKYTGDAEDVSPELKWSNVPANARELVLIVDDPDAPSPQPWVHWVIYKIPASEKGLPEGVEKKPQPAKPKGAVQGKNSWDKLGYGGPLPPRGHGVHHYHFKLYALDMPIDAGLGLTKEQLLAKIKGHVVAEVEVVGTYERK